MSDGWWVDRKNIFPLGSSCLANHSEYLWCGFYYLPSYQPKSLYQHTNPLNTPSTWLATTKVATYLPTYLQNLFSYKIDYQDENPKATQLGFIHNWVVPDFPNGCTNEWNTGNELLPSLDGLKKRERERDEKGFIHGWDSSTTES
jgi:hypothetical protein